MKRATAEAALCVVLAAGAGAAVHGLEGDFGPTPQQLNEEAEGCAPHLGNTAITSQGLWFDCRDFTQAFNPKHTEETTVTNDAAGGVIETTDTHTWYHYPSAAEFSAKYIHTPAELAAEGRRDLLLYMGMGAAFGGIIVAGTYFSYKIKEKPPERINTSAETAAADVRNGS